MDSYVYRECFPSRVRKSRRKFRSAQELTSVHKKSPSNPTLCAEPYPCSADDGGGTRVTRGLCTKSGSNSPRQRTTDSSPAVHCWVQSEEIVVREADGWGHKLDHCVYSRPLHGIRFKLLPIPAMNRWAIFSRPLTRTECKHFLCKAVPAYPWILINHVLPRYTPKGFH